MIRISALFFASILCASEVRVDLRNPVYQDGVVTTTEGGVIQSEDLRIQAMDIRYYHRMEDGHMVQRLEASGDLMLQYKGKAFVGSSLSYDLLNKTGCVIDGKTFASLWYIGGRQVELSPDGSYKVKDAFVTTCENKDSSWDLHAQKIRVMKDKLFEASNVRIRLLKKLSLWMPSLKLNLKKFEEPIFRYYVNWLKGPKFGIRYQLYSWQNAAVYGRLEYRLGKGWGGALETEYLPDDKLTSFVTKSYGGTDRLFNAVDVELRYRFQGALKSKSQDETASLSLTWDKYSDVRMPGDFKSDDFEIDTALKTMFYAQKQSGSWIRWIKVRPKVNPFDSINQDLPALFLAKLPQALHDSKIYSNGYFKASYLNFSYSTQLTESLQNFSSPRIEGYKKFERPIQTGPCTLTPYIGGRAIFYGSSPEHVPQWFAQGGYGLEASARAQKQFPTQKHIVQPYLRYSALTAPTSGPQNHYIFSIQDGFDKLQQVALGVRNLLFTQSANPWFSADLFATAFFKDPVIPQVFPYGYLLLHWHLANVHLYLDNCYNFRHKAPQFSNTRLLWTISDDAAIAFEARYRSEYSWRKADQDNFLLDVTRPESELLLSPISDRRITLLSRAFIRLNPFWELKWESHHGFYRMNEPAYNEFKIYLSRWVSSAWKLNFYYGYTLHNHFDWTIGIKLMKKDF